MASNFFKVDKGLFLQGRDEPVSPTDGNIYLDSTTGKFRFREQGSWKNLGDGSGGAGFNYIEGGNAEQGIIGWTRYANTTASNRPDDFGGTPNVNVDFDVTAVDPGEGLQSFIFSKDANNRQGEGIYYEFTLRDIDIPAVLRDQIITKSSANYADDDISRFIVFSNDDFVSDFQVYDLVGGDIKATEFWTRQQQGSQQVPTGVTKARLCYHIASTNADAYDVEMESLAIGPNTKTFGPIATDWKSYTPTFGNFGTVSNVFFYYRRVGDSIDIIGQFTTGTVVNGTAVFTLPSGLNKDDTKINIGGLLGTYLRDTSAQDKGGMILGFGGGNNELFFGNPTTFSNTNTNATNPVNGTQVAGSSERIIIKVNNLPIQGWSSSQQMSDDADTRVVAMSAAKSSGSNTSSGSFQTVADWDTPSDTHSALNTTSGIYTVPVSGYYAIDAAVALIFSSASTQIGGQILVRLGPTGSFFSIATSRREQEANSGGVIASVSLSGMKYFEKGGQILLQSYQDSGGSLAYSSGGFTYLNVRKVSGPSQIAANELVAAKYEQSSGQTIFTGSQTTVEFPTKVFDTHNAFDQSIDAYRLPASGKYRISCSSTFDGAPGLATYRTLIEQNTVTVSSRRFSIDPGTFISLPLSTVIDGIKGDVIAFRIFQDSGSSQNLTTLAHENQFEIERIGF